MKKQNKKKKYLVAASALALLALGAGTFAWFTSEDNAKNHFEGQLAANDITIVETYVPEKDWEPGEGVNKDVAVKNESEYDTFIRVSFAESLQLLKNHNEIRYDGTTYLSEGVAITPESLDNLIVVPSKAVDAAPGGQHEGFVDVTGKLTNKPSDITVGTTTYEFKLYAKTETVGTDTQVTYFAQWTNGTDLAKAYIQNVSTAIEFDKAADSFTIATGTAVQISLIDKTYDTALEVKWPEVTTPRPEMAGDLITFNSLVEGVVPSNINLIFADELTATPTANKWFFNTDDNYFYYIGIVPAGQNTAQLLDEVKLLGTAGNEFSLMQYDLIVNAEGVQALSGSATDTWGSTWGTVGNDVGTALDLLFP